MLEKLKAGFNSLVNKITTSDLKEDQVEAILSDFKLVLIQNDVALPVAEQICEEIKTKLVGVEVKRLEDRKKLLKENLHKVLLRVLETQEEINLFKLAEGKRKIGEPLVIVFVGINGTGKTTSIAKIAKLFDSNGFKTVLAASDTYRAGSLEQLEEHAKRLKIRLVKHRYGADPAAVAFDAIKHAKAHGAAVVLVDTAGRIQTDRNLMNELAKVKRVVNPDLTILVIDALTGNDAVMQAEEFNDIVAIDGTILTKVDADSKGGSALSVTYVTGKPILFIGVGQNYDDLEEFKPERFTHMILP
jgi:fused signal recognition particle receptor